MMRRTIFLIGGLWLTSLVLTASLTWWLSTNATAVLPALQTHQGNAAEPPAVDITTARSGDGDETAALQEEIDALEAKNLEMGRKYFHLSLEKWAEANDSSGAADPVQLTRVWDGQIKRMGQSSGVFDFEGTFSLIYAFATYGEQGIVHLENVLHDRRRNDREREMAMQVLRYLSTRRAFEAVLDFRDPNLTELDYPYDLIQNHLRTMDKGELAHRFPDIISQIDHDLGSGEEAPERVEVLLSLAGLHGDPTAQRLLRDPRILDENLSGAIPLAQSMNSPVARDFLTFVRQNRR